MQYVSTRGRAPQVGFEQVLLDGLAPDGGLYVPVSWPRLSEHDTATLLSAPFAEAAAQIVARFAGDAVSLEDLRAMAARAYAGFDHPDTAPVSSYGDERWLLELYHGPTLAFKDVAMQFLGQLFEHVLAKRGGRLTIIGATSGDTGAAAIEAFAGLDRVDVFILHPKGRVSDVQRRIMTSVLSENIYNIAIDGTFDDCQRIVKTLFADRPFAEGVSLGGVNSINWIRLAVQIVYYFTAPHMTGVKDAPLSFSVPTGNFGDIFAGYAAKRMGAPVDKLIVAVNENDILHRALATGEYAARNVIQTTSPSMDIQVASNFERLMFEAGGRDHTLVEQFIAAIDAGQGAHIDPETLAVMRQDFVSARAGETEIAAAIKGFHNAQKRLIDPHTAVGVVCADKVRADGVVQGPVVTLSTAHPAKFPEAVAAASGETPSLPAHLHDLYERPEKCVTIENDAAAIKAYILNHTRADAASSSTADASLRS